MPLLKENSRTQFPRLAGKQLCLDAFQSQRMFSTSFKEEVVPVLEFGGNLEALRRSKFHYKTYDWVDKYPLTPSIIDLNKPFAEVLMNRVTFREYDESRPMTFVQLSNLLMFSVGKKPGLETRFYPSPGALYAHEIYFTCQNVEGLEEGVYHYNVRDLCVEKIWVGDVKNLIRSFVCSNEVEGAAKAAVCLLFTCMFDRLVQKYDRRGYRFAQYETGCIMGNIYQVATALGLGPWAVGALLEDRILPILRIDGVNECLMTSVFVGVPVENESYQPSEVKNSSWIKLISDLGAKIFASKGRR